MSVIPNHDITDAEVAVFSSELVDAVPAAPFIINGEEVPVTIEPEIIYIDGSRSTTCKSQVIFFSFLLVIGMVLCTTHSHSRGV